MPTDEQQEVIYSEEDEVYVKSKAGTGKTTTLEEYVKLRKKEKFLYIVYNATLKIAAQNRFPENTEVHNIHSLAYKHVGVMFQEKLAQSISSLDIYDSLDFFVGKKFDDEGVPELLLDIARVLKIYFGSAVLEIDDLNIDKELAIDLAKEYWLKMQDLKNTKVFMTHDGYLKLFHLSNPVLEYDYILVDEAQDSNEVMVDIVYSQNCKKVFVGDDDQKIYGFRGAINLFRDNERMSPDAGHYYLTKSFRFGENIATMSNLILRKYKPDRDARDYVKGCDKEDEVGSVDRDFQYTIITRTNAHLFDIANENVRNGKKIHILGNKKNLFNDIKDVFFLFKGKKELIKSDFIKGFKNFNELKNLVKYAKMTEMSFLIGVIDKYQESIIFVIEQIEKNQVSKKVADVVLTTVHQAKGLEFADVLIASDFVDLFDDSGKILPFEQIGEDEINIYYTAVTRAVYTLEPNAQLKMLVMGEKN